MFLGCTPVLAQLLEQPGLNRPPGCLKWDPPFCCSLFSLIISHSNRCCALLRQWPRGLPICMYHVYMYMMERERATVHIWRPQGSSRSSQPVGYNPFGKPLSPRIFTLGFIARVKYNHEVAVKIILGWGYDNVRSCKGCQH